MKNKFGKSQLFSNRIKIDPMNESDKLMKMNGDGNDIGHYY